MSLTLIDLNLSNKLRDREYRRRFFSGTAQDEVAVQIRNLRDRRGLRQIDLASLCDMKQSAISRLESAGYARWSFASLLRIAEALDALVHIELIPSEQVIEQHHVAERKKNFREHLDYAVTQAIGYRSQKPPSAEQQIVHHDPVVESIKARTERRPDWSSDVLPRESRNGHGIALD